jgi:hypothetical protein
MKNLLLFAFFSSFVNLNCAQKTMNYNIKRTDYVKGTYITFTYEIRNDSVYVTRYSTNNQAPKMVYSNKLTSIQIIKLQNILNVFDLKSLNEKYIDENVEGECHSVYDIKIEGVTKNIYVYFVQVPILKKLDNFIYEILPEDKNSWY